MGISGGNTAICTLIIPIIKQIGKTDDADNLEDLLQ